MTTEPEIRDESPPASGRSLPRPRSFQSLMPFRVREVLLVASRYDAFILEEEGKITDLILEEYDRLNLRYAPRLNPTPSASEALELLDSGRRFDLVIVTMHPAGMDSADFARAVSERHPELPVVLLGYDNRELEELRHSPDADAFSRIFIWTGDARILLAIVSLVEDERNAAHDTSAVGVEVILFVEDSVHFVSSVLPLLYQAILRQSQRLIGEGLTLAQTVLRMRARPKILHASSYEEALDLYERYRRHLLGVISDVSFHRDGAAGTAAGPELARHIRTEDPDLPIVLLSSDRRNERLARAVHASFIHKRSAQLRSELEQFMHDSFGFGPFVFRDENGTPVATANDVGALRECLETVPESSVRYHSERRHFSTWLRARAEFELADALRARPHPAGEDTEALRRNLIEILDAYRRRAHRSAITEFDPETFGKLATFARIGGGSLGGKARGLAFLNQLLLEEGIDRGTPDVEILVPPFVVIGTESFDRFMDANALTDVDFAERTDAAIRAAFLAATLPADLDRRVAEVARAMPYPCAVRSSSLLEDSQHQPFAGVYETYMVPGTGSADDRHAALRTAIKLVYASTFSAHARAYLEATPHRPDKEKMAVIVQRLIGRAHGNHFLPTFAGVAQSYNYYPFGRVKPTDGAARVAIGLGRTVVEGRGGLRFCPRYPRHLPQFSSVDDVLANAQKEFDALRLDAPTGGDPHERFQPVARPIEEVLEAGTSGALLSVYDHESHVIHDGAARAGTALVTFAGVLKHEQFPLARILRTLLTKGTEAMSTPVEIEFAVDMEDPGRATFACLQLRPLSVARQASAVDVDAIEPERLVVRSGRALGHGRIDDLCDIVCVEPDLFVRKDSVRTASDIADLDAHLRGEHRPYLLIGPGRWGSADPWLGIPVNWGQIAGARIIVETGFRESSVIPSEGSHFFHNLTAFQIAYLTIDPEHRDDAIDWPWLLEQPAIEIGENGLRWIRVAEPLVGLIDGETGRGIVLKADRERPAAPSSIS